MSKKWKKRTGMNWKNYIQLRCKILADQTFLCKRCSEDLRSRIYHLHHKDENSKNNNLYNLEVLCVFCHKTIHQNKRLY